MIDVAGKGLDSWCVVGKGVWSVHLSATANFVEMTAVTV
jgi:hypothetical protein